MNADPNTGVVSGSTEIELVPLNLGELDEEQLLAIFPTPVQCAGALLVARQTLAEAPAVLNDRSRAVKDAKRNLIIARGYAYQKAQGRDAATRRLVAESDADVIAAWEAVDTAELALEYARDVRRSLTEDIEILRSLNANFRGEHR